MPFEIRPYRAEDLLSIYEICWQTAEGDKNASDLLMDKKLVGNFYAAPYAVLEPDTCFVVTQNDEVCGYIVGCKSSEVFSKQCEVEWFPELRKKHPLPEQKTGSLSEHVISAIHDGYRPRAEYYDHPAHLHINLLEKTQGHGLGRKLIAIFLENLTKLQVSGVHLEVSKSNKNAISFYEKAGFTVICEFEYSIGYGIKLWP